MLYIVIFLLLSLIPLKIIDSFKEVSFTRKKVNEQEESVIEIMEKQYGDLKRNFKEVESQKNYYKDMCKMYGIPTNYKNPWS